MPKLTVFEKKETGIQKGTSNQSNPSLLSFQKTDLIEINLFNSERLNSNRVEQTSKEGSAQKKFNDYLIQAVDEVLTSLGEPVKNTIYFQLENRFDIPKNEIPEQIDEFTNFMHKIFGLGASLLEIKFMENLFSKIKVSVETIGNEWPLSEWKIEDMSFIEYIQKTREEYCNCSKNAELLQKAGSLGY